MDRRPVEVTAVWLSVINGVAEVQLEIDGKFKLVISDRCQDCTVSHIVELGDQSNGPASG